MVFLNLIALAAICAATVKALPLNPGTLQGKSAMRKMGVLLGSELSFLQISTSWLVVWQALSHRSIDLEHFTKQLNTKIEKTKIQLLVNMMQLANVTAAVKVKVI